MKLRMQPSGPPCIDGHTQAAETQEAEVIQRLVYLLPDLQRVLGYNLRVTGRDKAMNTNLWTSANKSPWLCAQVGDTR
jgi:hypothetical protein